MIHHGVQKVSYQYTLTAGETEDQLLRSKCPRAVLFPPRDDRGADLVLHHGQKRSNLSTSNGVNNLILDDAVM